MHFLQVSGERGKCIRCVRCVRCACCQDSSAVGEEGAGGQVHIAGGWRAMKDAMKVHCQGASK